jgi:hypothetical protein
MMPHGHPQSPPSFERIADVAWETQEHACRVWSLLLNVHAIKRDDIPDAKKTELARLMLTANVTARLRHLMAGIEELRTMLALELSPEDEAWLKRQLKGLDEKGSE